MPNYLVNIDGEERTIDKDVFVDNYDDIARNYPNAKISMYRGEELGSVPIEKYHDAIKDGLREYSHEGEIGNSKPSSGNAQVYASLERPSLREIVNPKVQSVMPYTPTSEIEVELSRHPFSSFNLDKRIQETSKSGKLDLMIKSDEEEDLDQRVYPKKAEVISDIHKNYNDRFALTDRGNDLAIELGDISNEIKEKYVKEYISSPEYKLLEKQFSGNDLNLAIAKQFADKYGDKINQEVKPYQDAYNEQLYNRYGSKIREEELPFIKSSIVDQVNSIKSYVDDSLEEYKSKPAPFVGFISQTAHSLKKKDPDYTALRAAKNFIDSSGDIIRESGKKGKTHFLGGAARGFEDKFFDVDTWTLGVTELGYNVALMKASEKFQKGEKITTAEEKMLEAAAVNLAVNAYFGSDLGRGYKAGSATAESIPFMLEFAVNPVSASGSSIAKGVLNFGRKRWLTNAVGKKATGALATIGGDAIAAAGMTATTGLPNVAAGASERMIGDIKTEMDDLGRFSFTGTENAEGIAEAALHSFTSKYFENQSEMMGNVFGPALKSVAQTLKDIPGVKYLAGSQAGALYRKLKNNPRVQRFAEKAQYHGAVGETAEEIYNSFTSYATGEISWDEFTDVDNLIDTGLATGMMSFLFGTVNAFGLSHKSYTTQRNINRFENSLSEEEYERWMDIKQQIKDGNIEDARNFIKATLADQALSPEQKKEEIQYMANVLNESTIQSVNAERANEQIEQDNTEIDQNSNKETGEYIEASIIDYATNGRIQGNIVGGSMIDEKDHVIWKPKDGSKNRMIMKRDIDPETIRFMPTQEVKEVNAEMVQEKIQAEAEHMVKYSPEIPAPEQGISFELDSKPYTIVQNTPEGLLVETVDSKGKPSVIPMTNQEYYEAMQSIIDAQEHDAMIEDKSENEVAPLVEENNASNIEPRISMASESVQPESVINEIPVEQESNTILIDENGNELYYKVPIDRTIEDLNDGQFSQEEIDGFISTNKAMAEKLLRKYSNNPPKMGTSKAKYLEARGIWQQKVDDAQSQIDYWDSVNARLAELREKPGDSVVEEISAMGEPVNGNELAAMLLANGNLKLLQDSYQNETGFGTGESRNMIGLFASKENGGLSIEEAGEQLMLADLENGTNFFDQSDPNAGRNTILDVLGSARTRGDLISYIKNNREALAERERQAEYEAYERWVYENLGMSVEEYEAYNESFIERNINKYDGLTDEELNVIFAGINERDYERDRTNDERGISGIQQGGTELRYRKGPVYEGTNEERPRESAGNAEVVNESSGSIQPVYETESREQVETPSGILNTGEEVVSSYSNNQINKKDAEILEPVPQGKYGTQTQENSRIEEALTELRRRSEEDARNAQADSGTLSERQQKEIEDRAAESYAKENGLWIPLQNVFDLGTPAPSGNENDVYLDTKDNSVYKVNNLMHSKTVTGLLDRILLHNKYFPETKYQLVGFSGFVNGQVYPVLKQEYITDATFATPDEINGYMQSLDFNQSGEAEYSNGEIIISDLRPRNVLKDAEGDIYVIDAEFKDEARNLETEQENIDMSVGEVKDVTDEELNVIFAGINERDNERDRTNDERGISSIHQGIPELRYQEGPVYEGTNEERSGEPRGNAEVVEEGSDSLRTLSETERRKETQDSLSRDGLGISGQHLSDGRRDGEIETTLDNQTGHGELEAAGQNNLEGRGDGGVGTEEQRTETGSESEFRDSGRRDSEVIPLSDEAERTLYNQEQQNRDTDVNTGSSEAQDSNSSSIERLSRDGDKAERIDKLRNSEPVVITGDEIPASDDLKEYKKNALEYGKKLQGEYVNEDTGAIIQLQRGRKNGGLKEILQHDYKDVEHLQSVAAIPQIIEKSIYIDSMENTDTERNENVSKYHYYVCGLKIGDVDYTVRATVAEQPNGERYYDHKLTQIEKGKLIDLSVRVTNPAKNQSAPGFISTEDVPNPSVADVKDTKLLSILQNVNELSSELNTPIRIIEDINEIPEGGKLKRDAKGWFDVSTGEVVVVLPNTESVEDVRETIFHEVVAHKGLREMFGKDFNTFLDNVYTNASDKIKERILGKSWSDKMDLREATEEYLAELAERGFNNEQERSLWQKIKDAFVDMLRKVGVNLGFELTDNELRYILWKSYQNLKENNTILDQANDIALQKNLGVGNYRFRESEQKQSAAENPSDNTIQEYEKALNKKGFKPQEAFQDSMLSVKVLQKVIEKIFGKKLKSFENAYLAENQMSSKGQTESNNYEEKFFRPLLDAIKDITNQGVSREDVVDYMKAKHGLERNDRMARVEADEWMTEHLEPLAKKLDNGEITLEDYARQEEGIKVAADERYRNSSKDYAGLSGLMERLTEEEDGDFISFAKELVEAFEKDHDTTELWKRVNAATKKTLRKAYESGMMSKETFDHVSGMYQYYIPLRGWEEATANEVYEYLDAPKSPLNAAVKKTEGRTSEAFDPIAYIGNMAGSSILLGNRNLMKQHFLNMAINHPTDLVTIREVWYINEGTMEEPEWVAFFPKIEENATAEQISDAVNKHEELMIKLQEEGRATKKTSGLNVNFKIGTGQANEHMVHVKRNGRDYIMFINGNPRAAQALNGKLNPDSQSHVFLEVYKRFKRLYGAGLTSYNPDFVVANFFRDSLHASAITYMNGGATAMLDFFGNIPKATSAVYRGIRGEFDPNNKLDVWYQEFVENGGETGYMNIRSTEELQADIDKEFRKNKGAKDAIYNSKIPLELIGKWIENANSVFENTTRFNAYITARERGNDVVSSVNEAKNISVNFNKKGAGFKSGGIWGSVAGFLQFWMIFFNPTVQGQYQILQTGAKHKARFAKIIGAHIGLGMLIPYINELLVEAYGDDEDDYWNQNEFTRRNNFMLFIPKIGYIKIPLAPFFRELYGLGEIGYSLMNGRMSVKNASIETFGQVKSAFAIEGQSGDWDFAHFIAPDLLDPIADIATNKNFMGAKIAKHTDYNALDPEHTRVFKGVSPVYTNISRALNSIGGGDDISRAEDMSEYINPAFMQHILNSYTGGVGKTLNNVIGSAVDLVSGDTDNISMRNAPVLNRLVSIPDDRTRNAALNREYNKLVERYKKIKHDYQKYEKEVDEGSTKYQKKIDELEKNGDLDFMDEMEDYIKDVNSIYKDLNDSPEDEELMKELNSTKKLTTDKFVDKLFE